MSQKTKSPERTPSPVQVALSERDQALRALVSVDDRIAEAEAKILGFEGESKHAVGSHVSFEHAVEAKAQAGAKRAAMADVLGGLKAERTLAADSFETAALALAEAELTRDYQQLHATAQAFGTAMEAAHSALKNLIQQERAIVAKSDGVLNHRAFFMHSSALLARDSGLPPGFVGISPRSGCPDQAALASAYYGEVRPMLADGTARLARHKHRQHWIHHPGTEAHDAGLKRLRATDARRQKASAAK